MLFDKITNQLIKLFRLFRTDQVAGVQNLHTHIRNMTDQLSGILRIAYQTIPLAQQ